MKESPSALTNGARDRALKELDVLRVTPQTLELHTEITPSLYYNWTCKLADMWYDLQEAKEAVTHAENHAKTARTDEVLRLCEMENPRTRKPFSVTAAERHAMVSREYLEAVEQVRRLLREARKLERDYKKLEGFLKALEIKTSIMPGLQGKGNRYMDMSR